MEAGTTSPQRVLGTLEEGVSAESANSPKVDTTEERGLRRRCGSCEGWWLAAESVVTGPDWGSLPIRRWARPQGETSDGRLTNRQPREAHQASQISGPPNPQTGSHPPSRALKSLRYAHSGDWEIPTEWAMTVKSKTLNLIADLKSMINPALIGWAVTWQNCAEFQNLIWKCFLQNSLPVSNVWLDLSTAWLVSALSYKSEFPQTTRSLKPLWFTCILNFFPLMFKICNL